jgi:hypothetical protein
MFEEVKTASIIERLLLLPSLVEEEILGPTVE